MAWPTDFDASPRVTGCRCLLLVVSDLANPLRDIWIYSALLCANLYGSRTAIWEIHVHILSSRIDRTTPHNTYWPTFVSGRMTRSPPGADTPRW